MPEKSRIVRIYKITCTEAYRMDEKGSGYSLDPWGSDSSFYRGGDDGGALYLLPAGYTIAINGGGSWGIFNARRQPVSLVGMGYAAIIDADVADKAMRLAVSQDQAEKAANDVS